MESIAQNHTNTNEGNIEQKAEKIAEELKVSLPASGSPLLLRLIALFTLIGGLSIIGSLFADIVRPPSNTPHFYFIRIIIGLLAILISYEIIAKSRLALWLYAVIVIVGLFVNPIVAVLPSAVLLYLILQRHQLRPSRIDLLIASLLVRVRK